MNKYVIINKNTGEQVMTINAVHYDFYVTDENQHTDNVIFYGKKYYDEDDDKHYYEDILCTLNIKDIIIVKKNEGIKD